MDDEVSVEVDDSANFININLYDTRSSSTILKVAAYTVANDLIDTIFNKVETPLEEQKYHSLVIVVTGSNESSIQKRHCVRTLKSQEYILDVESQLKEKLVSKYQLHDFTSRWYFKDIRCSPLELGDDCDHFRGELLDDETEISLSDLACIKHAERSGYLLKRSSKDPNVWLPRYCILTDKLWCVNDKLRVPTASCISLNSNTKLQSRSLSLDCLGAITVQSTQGLHYFIAPSSYDQQCWLDEISMKAALNADNDVIGMAEMIICDEASTRYQRARTGIIPYLGSDKVKEALTSCSSMKVRQMLMNVNEDAGFFNAYVEIQLREFAFEGKKEKSSTSNPLPAHTFLTPQKYPRTYVREMQKGYRFSFEAICFARSVNDYKEMFRHDLGTLCESQWETALYLLHYHLAKLFERVGVPLITSDNPPGESDPASTNNLNNVSTSIETNMWDCISTDTALELHRSVFAHIVKRTRKVKTEAEKDTVESNKGANGRAMKAFSKTPSAGGGDGSLRIIFGEGSSATPHRGNDTLWTWTSRALGLIDPPTHTQHCEEAEDMHYIDDTTSSADIGDCRGGRSTSLSCLPLPCNSHDTHQSRDKSEGAYISVISNRTDEQGRAVEVKYYLRDKNIRPDIFLFDELCSTLLAYLNTSLS